jgi:hypothetical protein
VLVKGGILGGQCEWLEDLVGHRSEEWLDEWTIGVEERLKLIKVDLVDTLSAKEGENRGAARERLGEEGRGSELGCALHIVLHKDSMCNVERGQNLLACLMLIRGNEGVDIDIREECGGEMGDGLEKDRDAGRVFRHILWGSAHAVGYETEKAREKVGGGLSGLIKFGLDIVR